MQVFLTSPWVPPEWIKAHGPAPRGIWFAPDFALEHLAPAAGVCSFANAVIHFAENHPDSAMVFTTHCDQLRRGFDSVAHSTPSRVFLFNLPATWQTPAGYRIFVSELERLSGFLLDLGGCVPTAESLAQSMTEYRRLRSRLLDAALSSPPREFAEAIARFHWDGSSLPAHDLSSRGPESAPSESRHVAFVIGHSSSCSRGRKSAPSEPSDAIPLALIGGPLPRSQWHLLDAIANAGGRVVLNATESGERSLGQLSPPSSHSPSLPLTHSPLNPGSSADLPTPPYPRSSPLVLLARASLDRCVDVFQRPNTPLYDWLKPRLAARGIRGIILWHYVGCDLWRAETQSLREAFHLPLLVLDANEAASDSLRQSSRIQAFLEAIT